MCPVLGCTSGRKPTRPGRPRDRTANRTFAQEAPAEDLPVRVAGFARRAPGACLRMRTVNNRHSGQSPGFLRVARRQRRVRQGGRARPGTCRASRMDAAKDGTGRFRAGRALRCRKASPKKNGGRHRQQQATAGTVTGETRSKKQQDRQRSCPCLRDKHSPHRTQGLGPKPTRRETARDPASRQDRFLARKALLLFSAMLFANHPLTGSDRVFFACPLAGCGRRPAR